MCALLSWRWQRVSPVHAGCMSTATTLAPSAPAMIEKAPTLEPTSTTTLEPARTPWPTTAATAAYSPWCRWRGARDLSMRSSSTPKACSEAHSRVEYSVVGSFTLIRWGWQMAGSGCAETPSEAASSAQRVTSKLDLIACACGTSHLCTPLHTNSGLSSHRLPWFMLWRASVCSHTPRYTFCRSLGTRVATGRTRS
eukprot:2583422-Prymnesium_polylepis.1